jgi:hypothetical protein
MPTPQTPYEAVLHAARDVTKVPTALEAELLGTALLGSVYAVADAPRQAAVREFVGGFLAATARRRTAAARAIRCVFAALVPDADGAGRVRPGTGTVGWTGALGRARPLGTWAYGDVYGDQTSFLAVFGYDDPETGGAEHAVVALVDHNVGIVKDLFVGRPAKVVVDEVRAAAESDELIWFTEVDPATWRERVNFYLEITDGLQALPDQGELATDRALVGARLAALPAGGKAERTALPTDRVAAPPDPAELVPAFLAAPEAAALDRSRPEDEATVQYAVRLILDFAHDAPDTDALRWSPAVVGLFLLDWVHRRAVLDDDDVAVLPAVLRAWTAWAGSARGLPEAAVDATHQAIDSMADEFARLHRTGERRSHAVRAATQMIADGVDPSDEAAVGQWLAQGRGGSNGSTEVPRPR